MAFESKADGYEEPYAEGSDYRSPATGHLKLSYVSRTMIDGSEVEIYRDTSTEIMWGRTNGAWIEGIDIHVG